MLVTDSFKGTMEAGGGCKLMIYAGSPPSTARAAIDPANTLLVEITVDGTGTGLTFEAAASQGTVLKNQSEVWKGTVQSTGTASFYRLVADGDTGAASDTEPRVQGNVAQAGAELNLSDVGLTSGAVQSIDFFAVNFPTL